MGSPEDPDVYERDEREAWMEDRRAFEDGVVDESPVWPVNP